jgi:hypothetical protein
VNKAVREGDKGGEFDGVSDENRPQVKNPKQQSIDIAYM